MRDNQSHLGDWSIKLNMFSGVVVSPKIIILQGWESSELKYRIPSSFSSTQVILPGLELKIRAKLKIRTTAGNLGLGMR